MIKWKLAESMIRQDNNVVSQQSGSSRISEKGVDMYRGVGVRFADCILFFLKYPMKIK